jgi:hypothetical protein
LSYPSMSGVLAMEFDSFVCVRPRVSRRASICAEYRNRVDNDHSAMITAANTPHTITTNALMICFSSETDIASGPPDQAEVAR